MNVSDAGSAGLSWIKGHKTSLLLSFVPWVHYKNSRLWLNQTCIALPWGCLSIWQRRCATVSACDFEDDFWDRIWRRTLCCTLVSTDHWRGGGETVLACTMICCSLSWCSKPSLAGTSPCGPVRCQDFQLARRDMTLLQSGVQVIRETLLLTTSRAVTVGEFPAQTWRKMAAWS